jgi:predicted RNA-binding protein with PUA domain
MSNENQVIREYRISDGDNVQEVIVDEEIMIKLCSPGPANNDWVRDMLRNGAVLFVDENRLKEVIQKPKEQRKGVFQSLMFWK